MIEEMIEGKKPERKGESEVAPRVDEATRQKEIEVARAKKDRNSKIRASLRARKIRMLEDPSAIMFLARTREGRMMAKIVSPFDRLVNSVRMRAGTTIPVEKAVELLREVENFTQRLGELERSLSAGVSLPHGTGGVSYETPESKMLMAENDSSYVYLPRSEESKKMVHIIKRIDPMLMQYRTVCTDLERASDAIMKTVKAVVEFHNLTQKIADLAKAEYIHPKGIKSMFSAEA
jgi:hypothetical protein